MTLDPTWNLDITVSKWTGLALFLMPHCKTESCMKLTKAFEKYRHNQLQVIELSCEIKCEEDIDELSYDDFEAFLFINSKKIADISYVLGAAGVFVQIVDDVDWHKEFDQRTYERKPEPQLSLFY